ncbi:MAG TPA: gluconolaconase, partial [Acidimicrobiia bacterium]|nr:gluconolaconase [Acidimicrobiia bacterium]
SRRAARAVLVLVLAVLTVVVVFGYFYGKAILPDPRPPLEAGWTAVVEVLAGDGHLGSDDGPATRARFSDLFGVAVAPDGTVFIADAGASQRIRRVTIAGEVSTVAGSVAGYADGTGESARFDTPSGIALGPDGAIYVADTGNNAIRRVTAAGAVSTIAGGRAAGYRDGIVLDAEFNGPIGVAVEPSGRIIVADTYNDRIRAIERGGSVVTIAGSGRQGHQDGPALDAQFDTPCGIAVDGAGNIFVADAGNGAIRKIDTSGMVSTVELSPPAAFLLRPLGVAVADDGVIYATEDPGRVVEIVPGRSMRVIAGSLAGFANGRGDVARMRGAAAVAIAGRGRLVVTDPRNSLIRLVTAISQADARPPSPPTLQPAFDEEQFASQPLLWPADPMLGPHEITGTMGEARGAENSGRFHAGLDVQAFEGSPVRVVRNGTVTNPVATSDFGTLNEAFRVGSVAYVHLRAGRTRRNDPLDDPRFVISRDENGHVNHVRVKRGSRFTTGEQIGTVNAFNHVHLNVGWPGEEINPLRLRLVQFADRIAPTIAAIHLVTLGGQRLEAERRQPLVVDQPVQVVVDAWDQSDGNRKTRRLGLYELGYQILQTDGTPVPGFETPRQTIRFDQLSPDPDAPSLVYASGSGIPFYGSRTTHFLYVVTNSLAGGRAARGVWDPSELQPGNYIIRVTARDFSGNEAGSGRDLAVVVGNNREP